MSQVGCSQAGADENDVQEEPGRGVPEDRVPADPFGQRAAGNGDEEQQVAAHEQEQGFHAQVAEREGAEPLAARLEQGGGLPPDLPELALAHPRHRPVRAIGGLSDPPARLVLRGRLPPTRRGAGADRWCELRLVWHGRPAGSRDARTTRATRHFTRPKRPEGYVRGTW